VAPRIALIDYKAGNLTSVRKALAAVGADVYTPEQPADLTAADGIIVPGVGHFGATVALDARWIEAITARVEVGRPLLGICLGLQWLYEGSEESPDLKGLGILPGTCHKLRGDATGETNVGTIKVPHVGWNTLELLGAAPITEGIAEGAQVYFTHSYVAPVTAHTAAATTHGERFASIVQRGQIAGVQFHPEKSGDVGLRILRNYMTMVG
jgi:glutamine amidotransferase